MAVRVGSYRDMGRLPGLELNTTSRSKDLGRGLSPFLLGPVDLWGGHTAQNVENAWQYSKVYEEHWDDLFERPLDPWYVWAEAGWNKCSADRYPMGKGAHPVCSWWNGRALTYLEARREIYVPVYARAVVRSNAFQQIKKLHESGQDMALIDFDGYDHKGLGMSYREVLESPDKKMGHAFVVAMLIEGALEVI